jgi:hypothetical protein
MKKQFAIKAVQVSKAIILSAAKKESSNSLWFFEDSVCCGSFTPTFQGLTPKTSFSL